MLSSLALSSKLCLFMFRKTAINIVVIMNDNKNSLMIAFHKQPSLKLPPMGQTKLLLLPKQTVI